MSSNKFKELYLKLIWKLTYKYDLFVGRNLDHYTIRNEWSEVRDIAKILKRTSEYIQYWLQDSARDLGTKYPKVIKARLLRCIYSCLSMLKRRNYLNLEKEFRDIDKEIIIRSLKGYLHYEGKLFRINANNDFVVITKLLESRISSAASEYTVTKYNLIEMEQQIPRIIGRGLTIENTELYILARVMLGLVLDVNGIEHNYDRSN